MSSGSGDEPERNEDRGGIAAGLTLLKDYDPI
jgi:hypothetical protein